MTNGKSPANICFRNIFSRIYFYTGKLKPLFAVVTFNAIFKIDLGFLDNYDERYHTSMQVL